MMQQVKGKPVSKIIGIGAIHYLADGIRAHRLNIRGEEVTKELENLDIVIRAVLEEIEETQKLLNLEKVQADILNTHKMILHDPEMLENIRDMISSELISLEHALEQNLENIRQLFSRMDDDYLAQRYLDYKDVTQRLINKLTEKEEDARLWLGRILVAQELTPSQVLEAYRHKANGLISLKGSGKSHTAILAKSLMLPYVTDVQVSVEIFKEDELAIVDGRTGLIIISPSANSLAEYRLETERQEDELQRLAETAKKEAITLDGKKVNLYCNIEIPEEIEIIQKLEVDGIGLFRTEFLYLDRENSPSEEEQYLIYRHVAEKLAPKPVIIRTMDIGGDKVAVYFAEHEENPNLGLRGIRMSFHRMDIFRQQLRAILRAAVDGNIRIMFPMISCAAEIIKARAILAECARELKNEGVPCQPQVLVGTMIEIPSAAIRADRIAPECDFFSIGTNDLVQYTLAVDRNNELVSDYYNETDVAVLELIRKVCQAAKTAGIKVAVCGEMASQKHYTEILLGLGVDELSTSPAQFGEIKRNIMSIDLGNAQKKVSQLLD